MMVSSPAQFEDHRARQSRMVLSNSRGALHFTGKTMQSLAGTCAARVKYVLALGLAFLAPLPAAAGTTYSYTGAPYTTISNGAFGTKMTGTVTFGFDTTGL